VGSNPTLSTSSVLVNYGIKLSSFLVNVDKFSSNGIEEMKHTARVLCDGAYIQPIKDEVADLYLRYVPFI
jgi:hypothetical protein